MMSFTVAVGRRSDSDSRGLVQEATPAIEALKRSRHGTLRIASFLRLTGVFDDILPDSCGAFDRPIGIVHDGDLRTHAADTVNLTRELKGDTIRVSKIEIPDTPK
jgi:hypothetical protein